MIRPISFGLERGGDMAPTRRRAGSVPRARSQHPGTPEVPGRLPYDLATDHVVGSLTIRLGEMEWRNDEDGC
ncbi:hypothetical protein GCM10028864_16870 [Microlunatus parietis]